MTKVQIYSAKGVKTGTFDFPKELTTEANMNLIAQVIYVYEARNHKGTSKVKTRGEVSASGAKIYKQKGTGKARHGDIKAPIFVGGGIAHGPKGIRRNLKLSKKLGNLAMKMILGAKVKDGRIVLVDKPESLAKTKDAQKLLDSIQKDLSMKKPVNAIFSFSDGKKEVIRAFRNIEGVNVSNWNSLNPYLVFNSNLLVVDKEALNKNQKDKPASLNSDTKTSNKTSTKKATVKKVKPTKKISAKKIVKKGSKK